MGKSLIAIFFLFNFFARPVFASYSYVQLELTDHSIVNGELIESYEDRWFWEKNSEFIEKYKLLFSLEWGEPKWQMINEKNIIKSTVQLKKRSLYRRYLQRRGIVFQNTLVENAYVLTGNEGHHKFERMFGNFAWDIGVVDSNSKTHSEERLELSDYYIFNRDVKAPLKGIVVGLVSNQEDNKPSPLFLGDLSQKENNYLTLKIDGPFYLSIVHFKQNSITVNIGDEVKIGQVLGQVGNSGVSYVPHLHYTLYAYIPELERFISVPAN